MAVQKQRVKTKKTGQFDAEATIIFENHLESKSHDQKYTLV